MTNRCRRLPRLFAEARNDKKEGGVKARNNIVGKIVTNFMMSRAKKVNNGKKRILYFQRFTTKKKRLKITTFINKPPLKKGGEKEV